MQDSSKYLIHADVTADGVVERSDVVGAVFGQTEGLLGDELDLRQLQDASKIGRIDVSIESRNGQSFGTLTIATNLDKVETATLAAALETITRVGPCRATVEVRSLEDLRSAKRRRIVDRAQELLVEAFDDSMMTSEELVEEVRRRIRVEDITEYEGLPAGPRVPDSDALVVVEGRSDVLAVLEAGVKNAIAVEGTNVPEPVAQLTTERTTTTFLDGDRGGDLILKELAQVGAVDHVAFAPHGESVEDLSRHQILAALRGKIDYDLVADADAPHEQFDAVDDDNQTAGATDPADQSAESEAIVDRTDGATDDAAIPSPTDPLLADDATEPIDVTDSDQPSQMDGADSTAVPEEAPAPAGSEEQSEPVTADIVAQVDGQAGEQDAADPLTDAQSADTTTDRQPATDTGAQKPTPDDTADESTTEETATESASGETAESPPETLPGHVEATLDTGTVRFLDETHDVLATADAADAFETLDETDTAPVAIILDGGVSQRLVDLAAQRGVGRIIATDSGSFVKRPVSVRLTDAAELLDGIA